MPVFASSVTEECFQKRHRGLTLSEGALGLKLRFSGHKISDEGIAIDWLAGSHVAPFGVLPRRPCIHGRGNIVVTEPYHTAWA